MFQQFKRRLNEDYMEAVRPPFEVNVLQFHDYQAEIEQLLLATFTTILSSEINVMFDEITKFNFK